MQPPPTAVGRLSPVAVQYPASIRSNGMDAPTLKGINVPKWKCRATT
jgi:hypothetical protein